MVCVFPGVVRDCLIWRWIPNPPEHLEEGAEEKDSVQRPTWGLGCLKGNFQKKYTSLSMGGGDDDTISLHSFPIFHLSP